MWPFKPRTANTQFTSKGTIIEQMNELRPLPNGITEWKAFVERIISGALIPTTHPESLEKALATMVMQLGPQEDHKPDAYFIKSLRKAAANQVASQVGWEIQEKQRKEFEEKQKAEQELAAQQAMEAELATRTDHTAAALAEHTNRQAARASNLRLS